MIDVTGCRFVVTAVGTAMRDVNYDIYTGQEFVIYRGRQPFTVEWVGGETPRCIAIKPLPIGQLTTPSKFLAVPVPETTAEHLAAAVLMKKPCGRELVDCLIENGVIDVDGEFAAKMKADTLAKAQSVCEKVVADSLDVLRHRPGDWSEQARVAIASHLRNLISELA